MKKSLYYTAFLLFIGSLALPAFAQQGGGRGNMDPKEMAKRQTDQMKESLELTANNYPR